jgi:hypothetical protein
MTTILGCSPLYSILLFFIAFLPKNIQIKILLLFNFLKSAKKIKNQKKPNMLKAFIGMALVDFLF